ncbi:structural maintenance of chromosomes protein 6-like [Teratosphaeria destructans]|uniref:Structural maintenance of chromosomes protein 6-like n=1 Tax=Teratosphaeria destructans TaxID=418781 RepID=A0A9W7SUB3_9PEZI|nr:structural maintenance of chromosomes protein 6-like [Teratosphaeria destructans]
MSQSIFAQFRGTQRAPSTHPSSSFSSDITTGTTSNMAPRKRSRGIDDIDGDDEVEIESATSSFRQDLRGRSRVTLAAQNGGSVVRAPSETLHWSDRELDSEQEEILSEQIVRRQMKKRRLNVAMEAGVVEEVYIKNFMCHSRLRMRLGPNINFIIGHNGSGKSAVLTALTMCLGGKASATNRASNLKSFIKEGQDSASLSVKIKNAGESAYKPDIYGRSITVERHFSRSGTSGFKIRNAEDRVITTKRSDLDEILDFHCFQLDNPINVLTQDMARQFLSSSSPAEKYKFFIRGTQLELLDSDYNIIEERHDGILDKLSTRKADIEILKAKASQAKVKKQRLENTRALRDKIARYRHMHAWVQVAEVERELEEYQREVETTEEDIQEKEAAAEILMGQFEGHDQTHEAAQATLAQLQEHLKPVDEQHTAMKANWNEKVKQVAEKKADQRIIKEEVKSHIKARENAERDIREENARIAAAEGPALEQQLAELEELKGRAEQKKREFDEHQSQVTELRRNRDAAWAEVETARKARDRRQVEFETAKATLGGLQNTQRGPFYGYKQNMDQLVRAINSETRWRVKPVGPLGKHVRLHSDKTEWASQLEKLFGANLDGFAITHADDRRLLKDLMQRSRCEAPILHAKADPIDIRGHEPDPSLDTVLRVLTIDNDLVRNQFIINQAIEQVVLFSDSRAVVDFMYPKVGPRPVNVKAAITHSRARGEGVRYEYSRTGNEKSSTVDAWKGAARIPTDREQQIRDQRQVVEQAQRDLEQANRHVRDKENALKVANQAEERHKRASAQLKVKIQEADDAVEEQNNLIESIRPQDGALQELERQLAKAKADVELYEGQYIDSQNDIDQFNEMMRELKDNVDASQAELDGAKHRVATQQARVDKLAQDRYAALLAKNEAIGIIDDAKKHLEELSARRDKKQETVEYMIQQARTISERVPVEEGITPREIDARLVRLEEDLAKAHREAGGTPEQLTLAWRRAEKEYHDASREYKELENLCNLLRESLRFRREKWQHFRKHISYRTRTCFHIFLSERQFRGNVLIDHRSRQLDLSVEPDRARTSDSGRKALTLSGGEKSFSTICLLLSIWEAMGAPLRCLDEFDVFMDNVNRATSMQIMIAAMRRSVGKQYVLITPQAMGNVEIGEDVKVHRMSDPERGQTALMFGTQGS